jgi:formylglycine-generating enzyme required for sulfatase activity
MEDSSMNTQISHPLSRGVPPRWASEWGEDRFGIFAMIRVGAARYRLRWIPEGEFVMGAREEERGMEWIGAEGRETPRHRVRISQGFWLGEVPVTQAFYEAVVGVNPSRFVSAERPVERVSHYHASEFCATIVERLRAPGFRLPTEAEWEYACRVGTDTMTWLGDLDIRGIDDAPILDVIAWYAGNSGVDFELRNGVDSSYWNEKQYPHTRAGTHPVGLKAPNPFGLYDLLGHVWEWCADGPRVYGPEPTADPVGTPLASTTRFLRGGSWMDEARSVRASCRRLIESTSLGENTGFRLAHGRRLDFASRTRS